MEHKNELGSVGKAYNSKSSIWPEVGPEHLPELWSVEDQVIAAKAGVHHAGPEKCAVYGLDSRVRGTVRRVVIDAIRVHYR